MTIPATPQPVRSLLWLVPLAMVVHNIEEAVSLHASLPAIRAAVSTRLGDATRIPSEPQYFAALVLVTLVPLVLYWWARHSSTGAFALFVVQITMGLNVLAHVGGAVLLGGYVPGLISALLVQAPLALVLGTRAANARWLTSRQWLIVVLLAVLLHGPGLMGFLKAMSVVV